MFERGGEKGRAREYVGEVSLSFSLSLSIDGDGVIEIWYTQTRVKEMARGADGRKSQRLLVNVNDVRRFDVGLATRLLAQPLDFLAPWREIRALSIENSLGFGDFCRTLDCGECSLTVTGDARVFSEGIKRSFSRTFESRYLYLRWVTKREPFPRRQEVVLERLRGQVADEGSASKEAAKRQARLGASSALYIRASFPLERVFESVFFLNKLAHAECFGLLEVSPNGNVRIRRDSRARAAASRSPRARTSARTSSDLVFRTRYQRPCATDSDCGKRSFRLAQCVLGFQNTHLSFQIGPPVDPWFKTLPDFEVISLSLSLSGNHPSQTRLCTRLVSASLAGFVGAFGSQHVSPRELRASQLGVMVCVEGVVTKCSLSQPKVCYAASKLEFRKGTY